MTTIKRILVIIIIILAIVLLYGLNLIYSNNTKNTESVVFTIEAGESLNKITSNLYQKELIKSEIAFKLYARISRQQSSLLAGEHLLARNMSIRAVLDILTTGNSMENEIKITIIEGWNVNEIANYLENKGVISKNDFLSEISTAKWKSEYEYLLDVDAKTIEGFLFPDTYRIFTDATASDIIRKMLDTFNNKLTDQMKADIIGQGKNIFNVVNLASIIEREVPNKDDKKIVADIFLKRIDAGIALQSDATVNYITGGGRAQPTYADLEVDSPYNTYKYRGLPPGPISNPGVDSIMAVIYPTSNPYYYFLTTLDDGTVIYSRTYEEHLNNKAKYLD